MNSPSILRLANEQLAIELLPFGATLHRFEVRRPDGAWRNLVLSRPDPATTVVGYLGATVGRFANRLDGARFVLDGTAYQLLPNEGVNQLHGGPGGISEVVWDVAEAGQDTVIFQLVSPDGDQGYPGELTVTAAFSLIDGGAQVCYQAATTAPTVVNLTTHPYFILGGDTIESHRLSMPVSCYTPTRPDLIPTGEVRDVDGLAFDFRAGRNLGEALASVVEQGMDNGGGIDHNFVVDGEGLREHVRLTGPDGVTLTVRSDAPAVQLYSGENVGRAGLAIEPQNYPDAPNHDNFPSAVLRPGEVYCVTTQWLVSQA